jgi:alcohol dehydrogenase
MGSFEFQSRTRLIFGGGAFGRLGQVARELGFRRSLLVADRGLLDCAYVGDASALLKKAGVEVETFHDFDSNPDTRMVEAGRAVAASLKIDSIIGLGGGSSLDCAKGINFLLTNGGRMQDYCGYDLALRPLLPMIGVPTTAGTGSEAQSYALITDAETHAKMACGAPQAAFRVSILDPLLTVSQPRAVTAATGFDAISHAVETYVTTRRNPLSEMFSREAWRLLDDNYERVLDEPGNIAARGAMQLGAYYAGVAIENSMLGATHACANPLTAHYDTTHGVAIALLLPTVVRWNDEVAGARYEELSRLSPRHSRTKARAGGLAARLEQLARAGGFPSSLGEAGVLKSDFEKLAQDAAGQWTGRFNPRAFDAAGALEVYQCAY